MYKPVYTYINRLHIYQPFTYMPPGDNTIAVNKYIISNVKDGQPWDTCVYVNIYY